MFYLCLCLWCWDDSGSIHTNIVIEVMATFYDYADFNPYLFCFWFYFYYFCASDHGRSN